MPSPKASFIGSFGDYHLYLPTSGGKAGKGANVTSTIQVVKDGLLVKQIRFKLADGAKAAADKAKTWINEQRTQSLGEKPVMTTATKTFGPWRLACQFKDGNLLRERTIYDGTNGAVGVTGIETRMFDREGYLLPLPEGRTSSADFDSETLRRPVSQPAPQAP